MPRRADGQWDEQYRDKEWSWYTETPPVEIGLIPYRQIPEKYLRKETFTPLTGGSNAFVSRLDTFFGKGYFNIKNEPGFLTPCLYNYAGRPDRTAETVTGLMKKYYTDKPDGLPGNDDSGAMSSWYAFQAMGFFPVAGQDVYLIGPPRFSRTILNLGNDKKLIIIADNLSEKNIYIESATLNGMPLDRCWFRHSDIATGGTLKLTMAAKPGGWGTVERPPSRNN